VDLVRAQLLLFASPSVSLFDVHITPPLLLPNVHAIQLRITAEDPTKGFQLSPGILRPHEVIWPGGGGIRVDTWLTSAGSNETKDIEWLVGTDFDSLLAKVIVKGATFEEAIQRGLRALRELRLGGSNTAGIKTNVSVLLGTLSHPDWKHESGAIDTLWLERNLQDVLQLGSELTSIQHQRKTKGLDASLGIASSPHSESAIAAGRTNVLLQPGSLFHLTLSNSGGESEPSIEHAVSSGRETRKHTITIASIGQNAFPEVLSGSFFSTFFDSKTNQRPIAFSLVQSTSANAVSSGEFELANPNDPTHIAAPMTGKIVELHPALKEAQIQKQSNSSSLNHDSRVRVRKGEALLIFSVMKMENVIAAPFDGYVEKIGSGVRNGAIIGEGTLVCVLLQNTITSRL